MADHDHDDAPELAGDSLRLSRSDLALLRRAARESWGVPDPIRTEALFQAARLLTDPETRPALRLAVIKTLATLDGVDQRDDLIRLARAKSGTDRPAAESPPPRIAIPPADDRPEQPPPTD